MPVPAQFGHVHPSTPKRTPPDRRNRLDPAFLHYFNTVLRPSVRRHGVKQAIICHGDGSGGEVVVDGRTRLDAALLEGVDQVPRMLYPQPVTGHEIDLLAFMSNEQRCGFSFIEKASFLVETKAATGWSNARLGAELSMDKADITRHVRPFERLPKELLEKAGGGDGQIPARALYALSQLDDVPTVLALADKVMQGLYCCESLEDEVRALKGGRKPHKAKPVRMKADGVLLEYAADIPPKQVAEKLVEIARKLSKVG